MNVCEYKDIDIKRLKRYKRILVTGPQRSGTRITAKIIAHDTEYEYVDENAFDSTNVEEFKNQVKREQVIIQCPAMAYIIHEFSTADTLIVFMRRPLEDIVMSQGRVQWSWWNKKMFRNYPKFKYKRLDRYTWCRLVYSHFEKEQRSKIKQLVEINYKSLSQHPLWIDKEGRVKFLAKQTI